LSAWAEPAIRAAYWLREMNDCAEEKKLEDAIQAIENVEMQLRICRASINRERAQEGRERA
jgi:hypothetical protein